MSELPVAQLLFDIMLGVVMFLGGFVLKGIRDDIKAHQASASALQSQINEVRVLVAGQYVTKTEMKELFAQFKQEVSSLGERMDKRLDTIEQKLSK
jgi:hypothetical protein